jgi:hypothetical protein
MCVHTGKVGISQASKTHSGPHHIHTAARIWLSHMLGLLTPLMLGYGILVYTTTTVSIYAVLGFFVPYLDREVILLPTPPYELLATPF